MTDATDPGAIAGAAPDGGWVQLLVSGLIGAGIALVCLLPPVLHFLSGPLGPVLGGYVAGAREGPRAGRAVWIGLLMGLCLALPVALLALLWPRFGRAPEEARVVWWVAGGLLVYVGVVGTLGALWGGQQAGADEPGDRPS